MFTLLTMMGSAIAALIVGLCLSVAVGEAEVLVDRRLRAEVRPIDGALPAVLSVKGRKCICSNSRTERILFMLERTGLDRAFGKDDVFSALSTPSGKPKPAPAG